VHIDWVHQSAGPADPKSRKRKSPFGGEVGVRDEGKVGEGWL